MTIKKVDVLRAQTHQQDLLDRGLTRAASKVTVGHGRERVTLNEYLAQGESDPDLTCACGRVCKTPGGLKTHERSCAKAA